MKLLNSWKKAAAAAMAAIMLAGSFTVPVMAHGHHGSSHHSSRSYCSYHGTTHKRSTSCSKYCAYHGTTHTNGRVHCY